MSGFRTPGLHEALLGCCTLSLAATVFLTPAADTGASALLTRPFFASVAGASAGPAAHFPCTGDGGDVGAGAGDW